jgi:hypothetical protein
MVKARSFKSRTHLFLMNYFGVREHSLLGLRCSTSVVVSTTNECYFTYMVNTSRHGLFSQNRIKVKQHNKHTNSLAAVAETNLRAHFALLKSCPHKFTRYAQCCVFIKVGFNVELSMNKKDCYERSYR